MLERSLGNVILHIGQSGQVEGLSEVFWGLSYRHFFHVINSLQHLKVRWTSQTDTYKQSGEITEVLQSQKLEVCVSVFFLQAPNNCVSPTTRYLTSLGFSVFFPL